MNGVKPPDTMAVCAPRARIVRNNARAPGLSVMRVSNSLAMVASGTPLSSATRSFSAPSNGISPRIARSVMPATCAPTPASAANSSMHSCPISVESMSARISFLPRVAASCTITSIDSGVSSASSAARASGPP